VVVRIGETTYLST